MSFEQINFKSNPNFKFKEIVQEKTECLASSYQFDCFKAKNGETYLISPFWDIEHADKPVHYISLINLKNKSDIRKLEGHKDRVLCARYFQDPYSQKDYIISCDRKYKVIVWDLSIEDDTKKNIFEFEEKYESFIYSVILMFEENDKIYAVSSTLSSGETWVHPLFEKDKKYDVKNTKDLNVYFMTYWWDEENKEHNIISCGKNKILISQYNKKTDYSIQTDEKHPYNLGGMVFKNKDKHLLITSATYGLIKVIDLQQKKEIQSIQLEDVFLYSFIKWNEHYILVNDCLQRRILILDMQDNFKIKSKVLCPEMYFDRFIKKIEHPIYGESILSVGIDWKIRLFVNRNITKNDEGDVKKGDEA